MPDPVAAEQPSPDSTHDDARRRLRQPPGDLGRAYRVAFVETGALEVVLPATEQIPAQPPARTSAPTPSTSRRTTTSRALPTQRCAPTEVLSATPARTGAPTAAVTVTDSSPPSPLQLARRSRAVLLGVALGILLGVVAVVLAGVVVASTGLLSR